ncbi:selenoprotein W-like protein [[Emmonsia] crescens]|uniref:Selenoprotein W-like protein n=1 Tax=[Emmonsia] crescens TaxID=73230 RepID=A0A0G2HR67_9EURO|nr:selenoprotein W-like protein [Emmonsia crescens UAMH 3008]
MSAPTSTRSTPAVVPAFNPQQIQQKQTQQCQRLEEEQNQQVATPLAEEHTAHVHLPRVTIKYCTQCKWLLRAAYFAQELLSTFSTSLGEVSLVPATGGVFTVSILHESNVDFSTEETVLWDRKTEGGFPETKQLKSLVRNIVDPSRDLGHVDRALAKKQGKGEEDVAVADQGEKADMTQTQAQIGSTTTANVCKDCA